MDKERAAKILKILFPTRELYEDYKLWRKHKEEERARQREYQRQMEERRAYMSTATADPEDDDYDPLADMQWKAIDWNDVRV